MTQKGINLVFYGPEGSGKSTQADLLSKKYNIPHLVSGDLVRKYSKEDKGIIGNVCKEALHEGKYVADSEMYVMWKQRLKEGDAKGGWALDGFPRNLTQAEFLRRKVEKYGQEVEAVFFIEVSEEESMKRLLKRARKSPDGSLHDSPERIKERLRHYRKGRRAVLENYKKRGILRKIDGERSIESIHKEIVGIVEEIKKKNGSK
ncbi:adenylate kinase family protein [Patescibacteria group bacterium]